ncbi:MAG: protein BatD [Leptolyngbya sp. SIO3F4]|nr:protein BatD [Leptolyngbya sp. SIO3F4]
MKSHSSRPEPKPQSQEQKISEEVFVRLELDKNSLYEGDQLVATYKLYSRVNIQKLDIVKRPEYEGFFTSEIDLSKQQPNREVINDKIYQTFVLEKTILFPQRSGTLTLNPVEYSIVAEVREGEPINTFFGPRYRYRKKKLALRSKQAKITVKPLPENAPATFDEAVGSFRLVSTIDKQEVEVNEAINLRYRLSGKGNIKLIELAEPDLPTDFEAYDPRVTSSTENKEGRVKGQKNWEYLLIPRAAGTFEIPALTFSYFDPAAREYRTLTTEPYSISVKGSGSDPGNASRSAQRKKDIQRVGKDIRYIKRDMGTLAEKNDFFFGSLPFAMGMLAPMLLLGGAYFTYYRYRKLQSDTVGVRKRKASRTAQQHLRQAQVLLDKNDRNAFFEEIFRALTGYLRDKLAIPTGDLNRETIRARLVKAGWSETDIGEVAETLEQCEMARFAPASGRTEQNLFERTQRLIERMEAKLK